MKRVYLLLLFLFPLFCFADLPISVTEINPNTEYYIVDNTAFLQACINSGCTLPTAVYTATNLTVTRSFNMQGSTINFTGVGASFVMNIASTSLTNGNIAGTSAVFGSSTQYGVAMSAPGTTVDHVNVSTFPYSGIIGGSFSNQSVTNNTIFNSGYIGVSMICSSGVVSGITIANNIINRGPQGINIQQAALIVRGQTGGTITNSSVSGNIITMPSNPINAAGECFEIRGCSFVNIYNNSFTNGTIGLSIVIGDTHIRAYTNTFQGQSLEDIEIGDVTACSVQASITSGKVGVLFDGITSTTLDTLYSTSITGTTSYPIVANSAFINNIILNDVSLSTNTNAIYIQKATGITINRMVATGNSTAYGVFLDTSPGGVTLNNSTFTGFTPKLFFFYKAIAPALIVNNVVSTNSVISPGTVCYDSTPTNILVGPNVNCVITPAAPIPLYSPNSYTFYVNTPISAIVPSNSGGSATSWTTTGQPNGILFSTSTGQFTGNPVTVQPLTTYTVGATGAGGTGNTTIKFTIIDRAPVFSYLPSNQVGIIGNPIINFTPLSTGGHIVSFTIAPALPVGISQNPSTGIVSGTATVLSPNQTYTAQAFNSGGSSSATFQLQITNPAVIIPNISFSPNTYVLPINSAISTISPINVGGVATGWNVAPSLPGNLVFDNTTGNITGTPVSLLGSTAFDVSASNATGTSHTTLHLSIVAVPPPAPILAFNPNSIVLTQNQSAILISPGNTGGAVMGLYSISPALVSGLSFNTTTALISGTPSVTSLAVTYSVSGSNITGTSIAPITIQVVPPSPPNTIRIANKIVVIVN